MDLLLRRALPCLLSLAAMTAPAADGVPDARPDIVVIVLDDLRTADCNWLHPGASLTPNLDRIAREGTVLANHHAPSPVCTPSRYTLLTGRDASASAHDPFVERRAREGQPVVEFNTYLRPGEATMGTAARAVGYRTGFYGKNHVVAAPAWKRGTWESDPEDPAVRAHLAANAAALGDAVRSCGFDEAGALYHNNPDFNGIRRLAVHNQDWVMDEAIGFLDRGDARPSLLWLATTAPHLPDEPERGHRADPRLTSEGVLTAAPRLRSSRDTIDARLHAAGFGGLPEMEYRQKALLLWVDDTLGALFQAIERRDRPAGTIVAILSDHGMAGKGTCYEGGTLTPALLWRQGGFPVRRIDAITTHHDLPATALALAGAQPLPGNRGHDLRPLLDGSATAIRGHVYGELGYTRMVAAEGWRYLAVRPSPFAARMDRAERQKRLDQANAELVRQGKDVFNTDPMAPFGQLMLVPGGGHVERDATAAHLGVYFDADQLFDTANDPREVRNLAADPAHASRLERLRALMRAELAERGDSFPLER